jgi:hypothetical protein
MNENPLRCAAAGVLLALAGFGAAAADLRPLSESEMSGVYGQGLADAGALGAQEQGNAFASGGDPQAALASLSSEGTRNLERQLTQQQLMAGTAGLQATIRTAQTLAAAAQLLTPGAMTLPVMPLPFLFGLGGLPALPTLPNNGNKH